MVGTVLVSFLCTLGIVLLLLCLLGALLLPPVGRGCCLIRVSTDVDCRAVRGQLRLIGCGLSRLPLVVVDCGLPPAEAASLRASMRRCALAYYFTEQQWKDYKETECHTGVSGT